MPTIFNGFASSSGALLAGETSGLGIDFTSLMPSFYSKSTNALMDYFGAPFLNDNGKIKFSRDSLATVTDSDGKIKWAPHNLLLASESFDASAWSKGANVTISANSAASPNGTTTADKITTSSASDASGNRVLQQSTSSVGSVIFNIWLRASTPQTVRLKLYDNNGASVLLTTDAAVTSTWTMFTLSGVVTANNASVSIGPDGVTALTNIEAWGAHLYRSDLGGMQANTSAYPMYNPTTPKNLLGYSEDFTASSWVKTNGFIEGNGVELVTNGTFDTDTSGWTAYNSATLSQSSGELVVTLAADGDAADQTVSGLIVGKTYRITVSITSITGGRGVILFPGKIATTFSLSPTTKDFYWVATSTTLLIRLSGDLGATEVKFDNISIQEVAAYAAPNGSLTAEAIVFSSTANSSFVQILSVTSGSTYTFSVWLRVASGTLDVKLTGIDPSYGTTVTVTDAWQRFSVTQVASSGTRYPGIYVGAVAGAVYAWGAQLSNSASLDPYVPNFGPAPSAAAYHGPRLDFDPVTLSAKGLLVEEGRANLLQRSQEFNTTWSPTRVTVSSDVTATTAPDGSNTADKLVEDNTASASHFLTSSVVSFVNTRVYTFSIYAKSAERTQFGFNMTATVAGASPAIFDLSTETVVSAGSFTNPTITPVGNSWYRCTGTITATGTDSAGMIVRLVSGGSTSYNGDNTSGIYLWGAQLEENAPFATSYIPTSNQTVTRNADVASVGVSQFPYNQSNGSLIIHTQRSGTTQTGDEGSGVELDAGTLQLNIIQPMYDYGSYNRTNLRFFASGSQFFPPGPGSDVSNFVSGEASRKIGVAYVSGNTAVSTNGLTPTNYTDSYTVPSPTRLKLSTYSSGIQGSDFNGWIRQITYLPRRITNAELQTKTR